MPAASQTATAQNSPPAAATPRAPKAKGFAGLGGHLVNIYRLMIKELRSIRSDPIMLALVAYSFTIAIYAVATDISGLLLLQHYLRGKEVDECEGRKDEPIGPEIRKPESFGEGADADRLKPGRWKHQADKPSLASEGGHRHQQTGKVYRRYDGENRGRKDCRDLGLGEGRDELPEAASGEDVNQRPQREGNE